MPAKGGAGAETAICVRATPPALLLLTASRTVTVTGRVTITTAVPLGFGRQISSTRRAAGRKRNQRVLLYVPA